MNPDNVAPIALQDLRSTSSPLAGGSNAARRMGLARAVARVLRAWMDGWTWYARQGFTPAAAEPAFPFRETPRVRRTVPAHVRRLGFPAAPLPVARLYDCATGAGCA